MICVPYSQRPHRSRCVMIQSEPGMWDWLFGVGAMIVHAEEDLSTWRRQWANFHVLLAMTTLGFFDLMADGEARTADQIAQALSADSRAIDICGRILVHAGLLNYQDKKFQLTQAAL